MRWVLLRNNITNHLLYGSQNGWQFFGEFEKLGVDTSYNKDIYFTITIDGENNTLKQFVNGKLIETRYWNEEENTWDSFISQGLKRL